MEPSIKPKLHPVIWIAAVSVTALSLAGVGAIMGIIPTVGSKPSDPLAAGAPTQSAPPVATPPVPVNEPVAGAPPPPPEGKKHHSNGNIARADANPPPPPTQVSVAQPPIAPPVCHECGNIENVRQVEIKGEGSGLGAVGGAVVGGLLGSNVGGGHGKDAMTVLGAIGGGLAGNQIEKNVKKKTRFDIVVRFDDGNSKVFSQEQMPSWRIGDRVRVVSGQITALN